MLDNPFSKEIFPNIQSKPPLAQLEAISFCPIAWYLGEETDTRLPTTSFQLVTLHQLRCPSLDTLQPLNVPLVVRGPNLNTVFEVGLVGPKFLVYLVAFLKLFKGDCQLIRKGISNCYHLLLMLKLGTAGSETSLSSICSSPMAIRAQYQLSAFRSEQGGGTFVLLPEVKNCSNLPQGSLHPAEPLDIPPPQAQALTSVETLLISHLPSLIVNSLHNSFCRSLDTQQLDHYTPPTGEEDPITHSPKSQNRIGWKRPLRSSSPTVNLTLPRPPLYHVPKHLIQTSFKYLQGWRLNHFPGQPGPMLDNPFSEEKFPNNQSKPPLAQLEAISSRPITCYLGEDTDPHLSTTSSQVVVESDKVSPQPPFLQAKQPQLPQLLLIRLLLQTLHQLRCPSLHTLQPLHVSLVARGPKLNTVFEVRPHQCRVQGHDHFPSPAGHAMFDTSQDAIGFLGHLGTLLAHIQPAVNQHPQVLFCQAAFQPLFPKPVALHGVAVAQVQDLALGLVKPHTIDLGPSIQPVQVPLQSLPTLKQINTPTQLGVICKLTEGALEPFVQIIDKDIKQDWPQHRALGNTASLHAEHDAIWYGIALWSAGASCPGCVPSQLLVHPQPTRWWLVPAPYPAGRCVV
ncbi:hypothetical protein QYF61_017553 [Mycteria americana]|uniref:Uncharacterized protein n=1 Tax=Mycteria americana TaxID=33587 RepID=A0AAN7S918_MYCAM|nr:hypothetical protein QYF61_017553 [Mycteria americana]